MGKIHFTAKDILQKDFKQKIRGYDPTDVDSFLDMVIRDYETFNKETQQLRDENDHLRDKIDELDEKLNSKQASHSFNSSTESHSDRDYERPELDNATYMDILKRLSHLENRVFGSHMSGDHGSHRL